MTSSQIKELMKFWNELKSKAVITFKDIEELENLLGKVWNRMHELEVSRNHWKEKYKQEVGMRGGKA